MLKKIKNIISKTDSFFYKRFGSDKSTKILENISEAQIIFNCLNKKGIENQTKFVGGCVRKAINGEEIDDIDLATSLTPDQVKNRLSKEDIRIIDTGIEHGTLTLILNKRKFEITTLRKDILTDGRHANVEFTTNWEMDASRRDFTINAIYADIEGRIYDPLNGMLDLKKGNIKFIGITDERIQEDYLRILRYFRFYNQYSKTKHDHNVIGSIKKNINGLNKISNERIFVELKKILKNKNFYNLFTDSNSKEILLNIFPQFKYYERLKIIDTFSPNLRKNYDTDLILSLLILDDTKEYEYFCHKYSTSNSIKNKFKNISTNFETIKSKKFYSKANIKKLIYLSNKDYVKDLVLFSIFINKNIKNVDIEELIKYVDTSKAPKFPISGEYLKSYGYVTGEELGKKLKSLKEEWIENNFVLEKKILEKSLRKKNKN